MSDYTPQLIARSPNAAQLRKRQQQKERQAAAEEAYVKQQAHDAQINTSNSNTTNETYASPIKEKKSINPLSTPQPAVTLSHAFHFIHHIKDVFIRTSGGRMNALDGYRAWLCLWMFAFHGIWFMGNFCIEEDHTKMGTHPILLWTILGFLPVDGFFILTGFLIAYPLFSTELKSSSNNFSLRDFWYRRMMRMLPIYYFFIWFASQIIFPNDTMYPRTLIHSKTMAAFYEKAAPNDTMARPGANPLYLTGSVFAINNLLPFGGFEGWTWSLAVQFQFYLWFPVIYGRLRSAARTVRVCWIVFCLAIIYRIYAFMHLRYFHQEEKTGIVLGFWYYSNTLTRMPAIIMGVLLAYYSLFTPLLERLRSSRLLRIVLLTIVLTIICTEMQVIRVQSGGSVMTMPGAVSVIASQERAPLHLTSTNWRKHLSYLQYLLYTVFVDVGSPLSALFFAYIMIISVHAIGMTGSILNRMMTWSIWYPISTLSYWIYLLHPAIMIKYYSAIVARTGQPLYTDIPNVAIGIVQLFGITFAISLLCHIFVEKPLDILLRSGSWPKLTRVVGWYCMLLCVVSLVAHIGATFVFSWLIPIDPAPAKQVVYGQ